MATSLPYEAVLSLYLEQSNKTPVAARSFLRKENRYVLPTLRGIPLRSITNEMLKQITDAMYARRISEATIRGNVYDMMKVFRFAMDSHMISKNPCSMDFLCHMAEEVSFPTSQEEHEGMLNTISQLPLCDLTGFVYITSTSLKGALSMHITDVNLKAKIYYVPIGKEKGFHDIPPAAVPYLSNALKKAKKHQSKLEDDLEVPLFLGRDGHTIKNSDLASNLYRMRELTGKPTLSFLDLRRAHPRVLQYSDSNKKEGKK